ncbi:hypothetical protein [Aminobacter niigataensis]|uniref:Uncharacterized protein n=1 Tax=Aminobacter niigataensis TaxID=83265 RepID=A0ABR6L3A5_9HYPH|nr:hypothetical protein [Aminobacter niigataensis]MBB4650520.1 hypothetical protein [Aminobacter niigataensis]CAI2932792.1 conserved protein of unknown function [Aminobacter niigataensis]
MFELLQNLLAAAFHGKPADEARDGVLEDVTGSAASERLHRDLDTCFQAIHEQIAGGPR